jgi:hypothetical protein
MEVKSFVMFSSKTKAYDHDVDLGSGNVIKANTPITIAWMSFSTDGENLVAAFADDDTLTALMDKVPLVKRVSKSGKPRLETRYPVRVVYNDTDDPEVKEVVDLVELPPPSLRVCVKAGAKIASLLA